MNTKIGNFDNKVPFIWLFKEVAPEEPSIAFDYDDTLDLNVNMQNKPIILTNPFFAGTQTKTCVIKERDDSDD